MSKMLSLLQRRRLQRLRRNLLRQRRKLDHHIRVLQKLKKLITCLKRLYEDNQEVERYLKMAQSSTQPDIALVVAQGITRSVTEFCRMKLNDLAIYVFYLRKLYITEPKPSTVKPEK